MVMPMGVEAGDVAARAVLQSTAALRMALAGGRPINQTEGRYPSKRSTGSDHEVTAR
jgi:hypothetical protein